MPKRFISGTGTVGQVRGYSRDQSAITTDDASDPQKLSEILTRTTSKLKSLEQASANDYVEFDVVCPYNSTVTLPHGFTGAYRWYVTSWRRKGNAGPCALTEIDGSSTEGTLVLYSQVPGMAVIRIESVPNAQGRDQTTRTLVTPGGAGLLNLEFGAGVTTASTVYTRVGARKIDFTTDYPSITTVKFAVTLENSLHSASWSTQARLFDITNNVAITGTTLSNSAASDKALAAEQISAALTMGSSSGNIRTDTSCMYAVQVQATGSVTDTSTQWAIASNARLILS